MIIEKVKINNVKGRVFKIFGWIVTIGFTFNMHRN
jgi:hypothetical protein